MNLPDLANCAADLAATGLPVFPCKPDKAPATPQGFKDAVSDPAAARKLFLSCRAAGLIGAPTGTRSGITVVDVDPAGFPWMGRNLQRLEPTQINQTRRGYHLVYRTPDPPIPNSASLLAHGVDVRGEGGYVIWWPSDGLPIRSPGPPAPFPHWIIKALIRAATKRKQRSTARVEHTTAGDPSALERFVSRISPGQRNQATFWAACRAGEAGLGNAETALIQAAMASGLDAVEAIRTVRSGLARGARDGRREPTSR